jgi:hypothetical protein
VEENVACIVRQAPIDPVSLSQQNECCQRAPTSLRQCSTVKWIEEMISYGTWGSLSNLSRWLGQKTARAQTRGTRLYCNRKYQQPTVMSEGFGTLKFEC